MTQECIACAETKPLKEFRRLRGRGGGRSEICDGCKRPGRRIKTPCKCCPEPMGHAWKSFRNTDEAAPVQCQWCGMTWESHREEPSECTQQHKRDQWRKRNRRAA